ncbi:putative ion transporter superfamily protein YfcC [Neobacillus niacini]|nr:putative ion transporter superfamily protein YfcC [Neobacillus niacini]
MIVFVILGVILTKKLRLDPISALAVTFLLLFLARSVVPTGEALIGQMFSNGVPLYSGYGGRTIIFLIYLVISAIYVMFYTRRGVRDPSKPAMNNDDWLKELDDFTTSVKVEKVKWQDVLFLY